MPLPQVDGTPPPQGLPAPSRVAAVGPYIQSSTMPRVPSRPELVVKPALPDGPGALQASRPSCLLLPTHLSMGGGDRSEAGSDGGGQESPC